MGIGIKEKVLVWARSGGDFKAGLSLFLTFNRNTYYIRNIEAKGVEKGLATLLVEFSNKTKVPVVDLMAHIDGCEKIKEAVITTDTDIEGQTYRIATTITEPNHSDGGVSRKTMKLREEFPFLGRRDCPEEFAVLVNRMLTAYDDYRFEKEKLFDVDKNNLELCYLQARSVLDSHIVNREIWEELNYYKIHGTILGNVPEFKIRSLTEEFEAMSSVALGKIIGNNIPRKMSYYKKQLADKSTKNKDEIRVKIAERESEIVLIRKILTQRGEL